MSFNLIAYKKIKNFDITKLKIIENFNLYNIIKYLY